MTEEMREKQSDYSFVRNNKVCYNRAVSVGAQDKLTDANAAGRRAQADAIKIKRMRSVEIIYI